MNKPIPDLVLEQLKLDEADKTKSGEFFNHPSAAEKLHALEISNEEILSCYPPKVIAAGILEKMRQAKKTQQLRHTLSIGTAWIRRRLLLVSGSCAAVLMLLFGWSYLASFNRSTDRIKGMQPSIAIYRNTANGVQKLADQSKVRPKDLLQVSYICGSAKYGVIVSIDGKGSCILHFPDNTDSDAHLSPNGEVFLGRSYELDDAPKYETFYFLASDTPIQIAQAIERIKQVHYGALTKPKDSVLIKIELVKEAR